MAVEINRQAFELPERRLDLPFGVGVRQGKVELGKDPFQFAPKFVDDAAKSGIAEGTLKSLTERAKQMQKDIADKAAKGGSPLEKFRNAMKAAEELDARHARDAEMAGTDVAGMARARIKREAIKNKIFEGTDRERFDAFMELRRSVGGAISDKLPSAAEFGSVEAVDAINKAMVDMRSPLDELVSLMQAAKDIEMSQEQGIAEIVDAIKNFNPKDI